MKYLTLIIIILSIILACNNPNPYYSSNGGMDYKRVPLIGEYEIRNIDKETWNISFPQEYGYSQIGRVDSINVFDSIIIGRLSKPYYYDSASMWYIIIPKIKLEIKCSSNNNFLSNLSKYSDKSPNFIDCNIAWQEFKDKGYLKWFPENYK